MTSLEVKLGYTFATPDLLTQALTHSTYLNENPHVQSHNERLEFLGDAVVNLIAADLLYREETELPEGPLSQARARIVCTEALAELAQTLALDAHLLLGTGQRRLQEQAFHPRILADAFEALVAAVFLDGGYGAAASVFGPLIQELLDNSAARDFKSELQEACHKAGLPQPEYQIVEVAGPPHQREFHCQVNVGDRVFGPAHGRSKKAAHQACAQAALLAIQEASPALHGARDTSETRRSRGARGAYVVIREQAPQATTQDCDVDLAPRDAGS